MSTPVYAELPGAWRGLFEKTGQLIDDVQSKLQRPLFWTLGGGTVMMLRHQHRRSKDIDIFVPDPQSLGYFSPRLNDAAERISAEYEETSGHLKFFLEEGEIDIVASPNLTSPAYQLGELLGRSVKLETDAEIVAKKMWHRGDQAKARDLFDLSFVIETSPAELDLAMEFLARHAHEFVRQLDVRKDILHEQFVAIDTLKYRPSYEEAVERIKRFFGQQLTK